VRQARKHAEAEVKTLFKLIGCLVFVWVAIICVPGEAFAQGYGTISGTVTDLTGAAIPGAEVTATQASTTLVLKRRQVEKALMCFRR
jgi:hypothetical protein